MKSIIKVLGISKVIYGTVIGTTSMDKNVA